MQLTTIGEKPMESNIVKIKSLIKEYESNLAPASSQIGLNRQKDDLTKIIQMFNSLNTSNPSDPTIKNLLGKVQALRKAYMNDAETEANRNMDMTFLLSLPEIN